MIALPHKTKQYLLAALKVFILAITFYYIYSKLSSTNSQTLNAFTGSLNKKNLWILIPFFLLAFANWFFEITKWKIVIAPVKELTFSDAAKQSLAALTTSLATPNRIGDYGAKAYFFPSEKRKQVLLLNFISNVAQMSTTLIFGVLGLSIVVIRYGLSFSVYKVFGFFLILLLFIVLGYIFKEKEMLVKGFSIKNIVSYVQNLPRNLKLKVFLYSFLKYLCFAYLFFQLLQFFKADISFSQAYPLIFAMYLLVSVIPTIFILDVVIRGGVAVWLFSLVGVPELSILSTVLSMWLLNFVIPSIMGSFYVISYKPMRS